MHRLRPGVFRTLLREIEDIQNGLWDERLTSKYILWQISDHALTAQYLYRSTASGRGDRPQGDVGGVRDANGAQTPTALSDGESARGGRSPTTPDTATLARSHPVANDHLNRVGGPAPTSPTMCLPDTPQLETDRNRRNGNLHEDEDISGPGIEGARPSTADSARSAPSAPALPFSDTPSTSQSVANESHRTEGAQSSDNDQRQQARNPTWSNNVVSDDKDVDIALSKENLATQYESLNDLAQKDTLKRGRTSTTPLYSPSSSTRINEFLQSEGPPQPKRVKAEDDDSLLATPSKVYCGSGAGSVRADDRKLMRTTHCSCLQPARTGVCLMISSTTRTMAPLRGDFAMRRPI